MPAPRHCSRCDFTTSDASLRYCPKCGSPLRTPIEFYDAFVSYRREGGSELAELVRLSLQTQYGMNLFVDVNELRAGAFDEKLLAIIENSPCFVLILSKRSLDRCANEGDWLRQEIAHALKHGKRIVPVLAKGFVMPPAADLPEDIRALTTMNGVPYDHQYRDAAIAKIRGFIREGRSGPAAQTTATPRRRHGWVYALVLSAVVTLAGLSYYFGVYAPERQRLAEGAQRQNARQAQLLAEEGERQERERRESDRRAAARGGLIVRTTPSGAEVRVGVTALERSPLTLTEQKLGKYPVQIRLEGYEEWKGEVEITENEFTDLDIVLQRSRGTLQLTSIPAGLAVEVKGESGDIRTHKTPTAVELPTGEYSVTFGREGWVAQTETVVVKRKTTTSTTAEFVPGSMTITSEPAGCLYTATGPEGLSRQGKTPKTEEELPTGDYTVVLSAPGYKEAARQVTVKSMQTADVSLTLEGESAPDVFRNAMAFWSATGVPQDYVQAIALLRKAAEMGHAGAQHQLGIAYGKGQGVDTDPAQAVSWHRKAADQGHADAQNDLGYMYEQGTGVAKDSAQAVAWYRKAADQGLALAQCNIGVMYEHGRGVARDPTQAAAWYQKAADQGLAVAQNNLGVAYDGGIGVANDQVRALSWYQKAADQGFAPAQYNLGRVYNIGQGVPQNLLQAVAWYTKAADQGYAMAQYNLGCMYESGQGVEKDAKQAVGWFQRAAEQGYALAQYNLACMYETGKGVAKDPVQTVAWLRRAADQGYPFAQFNLGVMYARGQGVRKDLAQAVSWYRRAADQGNQNAIDALKTTRF